MSEKIKGFDPKKVSRGIWVDKNLLTGEISGRITGGYCGWCSISGAQCGGDQLDKEATKAKDEALEVPASEYHIGPNLVKRLEGKCLIPNSGYKPE